MNQAAAAAAAAATTPASTPIKLKKDNSLEIITPPDNEYNFDLFDESGVDTQGKAYTCLKDMWAVEIGKRKNDPNSDQNNKTAVSNPTTISFSADIKDQEEEKIKNEKWYGKACKICRFAFRFSKKIRGERKLINLFYFILFFFFFDDSNLSSK